MICEGSGDPVCTHVVSDIESIIKRIARLLDAAEVGLMAEGDPAAPSLLVADPYYMHGGFLGVCAEHRVYAREYIVNFMLANKDKGAILVPYHPM